MLVIHCVEKGTFDAADSRLNDNLVKHDKDGKWKRTEKAQEPERKSSNRQLSSLVL